MSTPAEKLAEFLEILSNFQDENGCAVIKANQISRTHKERLLRNGFIQEVIKDGILHPGLIALKVIQHPGTHFFGSLHRFI